MSQQPYFKGIPKKKSLDGILRVDPKAKTEVIKKVVETAKPDVNPSGPVAKKYLNTEQKEQVVKRAPAVAKKEALKNLTTNVTVETSYGNAVIPYKGFRALAPDQQRQLLKEMQAQVEASEDAKRKPEERPSRTVNRYDETKPVDVDAETKRILGMAESMVIGKNNPLYRAADKYVQDAKESNQDGGILGIAKGLGLGIAESMLRPASTFEGQVGNMYAPDATAEERLGAIGNAALYGSSVLPGARGIIAGAQNIGKQGFKEALKTGLKTFAREALPSFINKKINNAALDPVINDLKPASVRQDINFNAPRQADPASGVVTPPEPHFTNGYEPTGIPTETSIPATQYDPMQVIKDRIEGVKGADDVSGVTGTFRQPISKMPENRIESLSPQGRALESWAGNNLQKLLDNGVGEDLRTWDAVGKHYGAGAVPRNADDFDLWLNDLVRTVDENDRSISAAAESYGRGGDLNADLVALRDARGKSRMRKDTGVVALVPQGRGYRQTANSAWVPLSDVPMHLRRTIMDRVSSSETRFTSRNNYQAWVDAGKPEGGVLRPRMADEYMLDSFGGDSTMDDFILNPPKEAMVPRWAISDEIKNLASRYTEAGQASAAMRKPIKPQDFDDAVRYYNGESPTNIPVVEPTPTPIGSKIAPDAQPLQPQPTAVDVPTPKAKAPQPPVMADMELKASTAQAPRTEASGRTTGISNAANLTDFEQGLISSAPEGKGRSVKEIIETNKDRKDFDNVANRVANGESLTADNAAALLIGKAEYTKQVRSAKDALEKAITDGAKQSDIDDLRESLDNAIENATKFAEKVQRGKSEWSDIGRTLATMLNYDTRKIETVLQEARIKKGAKLTQDEIDDLTAKVNDLLAEDAKNKAEIERLMKAHADNAAQVAATRRIVRTPEARAAKRKQALDEFLTASSGLNAYVNPKVIKQFARYMYTLIEDGARSVEDIVAAAAKDGVKADVEDVYAAMRSQIKEPTLTDLQKEIAKTKRELMAEAKAADPAFVEDAMQKKIADMEDQIAKLKKQAEDGTLPAPKKKQVDDQIKALEEERRKALKAAQDASPDYQASLLGKDKERLRSKLKGLEDRIANKDYAEKSVIKQAMRTDDELDKLRQQVRVKDKIIQAAVEGAKPKTRADKAGNLLNEIKLWNVAARAKDLGANAVKGADFAASSLLRRGVDIVTAKILGEDVITKGTNLERTQRVLNKSKNRLKADAELIIKGADPDSIKKYGSFKGPGGKAAGLTDVPFKSFYYEWMSDAAADYKARQILGKNADPVDVATKREEILANIDEHPDIQLMAEEYSLNQTLNNSNWASETVGFWKKKAGNTGAVFVDEALGRFSKVITNVAIDATDRTGIGVLRGAVKIHNAKKIGKTLSVSERAIINDMITKGFTGLATVSLGYFLGDKVVGTIKGERGKYIDFGDIEGIGGPIAPFLVGATYKKSESIEDPEEAAALRLTTILRLPINTPLASNTKDLLNALTDSSSTVAVKKFAARKLSNIFLPGVVRDSAERMDSKNGILTGSEIEREKIPKVINPKTKNEVQTKNFIDILTGDVKSKIPFLRQTLPIKKTAEDKKADKKKEAEVKRAAILK